MKINVSFDITYCIVIIHPPEKPRCATVERRMSLILRCLIYTQSYPDIMLYIISCSLFFIVILDLAVFLPASRRLSRVIQYSCLSVCLFASLYCMSRKGFLGNAWTDVDKTWHDTGRSHQAGNLPFWGQSQFGILGADWFHPLFEGVKGCCLRNKGSLCRPIGRYIYVFFINIKTNQIAWEFRQPFSIRHNTCQAPNYLTVVYSLINHSSILPLMALNSLYCTDVPLSNYSLTHYSLYYIVRFTMLGF